MSGATKAESVTSQAVAHVSESHAGHDADAGGKTLLSAISEMASSLQMMRDIIQKANFIALNAAIEAARTQSQTENFTLVSDQVRRQAERTDELSKGLESDIGALLEDAFRARAVNLTDIANDLIDKVDRNLFERNCDMQAWAGFSEIVACARATRALNQAQVKGLQTEEGASKAIFSASSKLSTLVSIYPVYLDSFLVNAQGVVVASARSPHTIGLDVSTHECFRTPFLKKVIHVSDVEIDAILGKLSVSYCAPVKDENGDVIGVVSNRFDWSIVQDVIDRMPVDAKTKLSLINSEGTVIGSPKGRGVLKDLMHWLDAGSLAVDGKSGYTIECARNGQLSAWGFCHTFGFNAYPGKAWSALVTNPLEVDHKRFICEEVARESDLKRQASSTANDNLKKCSAAIQSRVSSINSINNETNMLAVNAAIQAGVAGAEGEAFSVIASEIGQLARQSEEFVNTINNLTTALGDCVKNTIYTRLGEASYDCIDKIDRNLFERNCDVQAFASFGELRAFNKSDSNKVVLELLRRLHEIYEVYHDILLLDIDGNVVASAIHRELIGQNQADRSWFRECVTGNLVVTDLYHSRSINDYTVTFAAPVHSDEGTIIGVLTTRFNCQFVYDIMRSTIVGKGAEVFLLNSKGIVIGSPTGEGILETSMSHLKAFRATARNAYGYTIEEDSQREGEVFAIGYARTPGYLNYPGKTWSVLIRTALQS